MSIQWDFITKPICCILLEALDGEIIKTSHWKCNTFSQKENKV